MMKLKVLLVLPLLIQANINIDITASEDETARQTHIYGSEVDIITQEEINTFQFTDKNLRNAVRSYLLVNPEAVNQKSPKSVNNSKAKYDWTQVSRTLKPIRIKIMSFNYAPTLAMTKLIKNKSQKEMNFTIQMRKNVENTIDSIWGADKGLMQDKNISYSFSVLSALGESVMSYTSGFGKNVHKSEMVPVGYETGVNVTLQPKQRARIDLYTSNSVSTVEIEYNTSISGILAIKRRNHYWYTNVSWILEAGGLNTYLLSSETISLFYNTDFELSVRDRDNNYKLDYS